MKVKLMDYNGTSGWKSHLTGFRIAFARVQIKEGEEDGGHCKLFVENLVGPALIWITLMQGLISNFDKLAISFVQHYSMFKDEGTTDDELWNLTQRTQPLRKYITKFKETMVKILNLSDSAAS
ncbi:hypothetical protein V5N11_019639 [Cardamine amara subsp. amara]|uniref:Retrotransposon gag domain-containing protein n=1 Tax=Cardamine amara subsp. amara TaxID=228776 RepID=A0ABD1A213_CARAN